MPSSEHAPKSMDPRFRGDGGKKDTAITPSLSSVESLRNSFPREHQPLFDTLRKEVMDFCDLHSIPTSSLNNDEALREATKHLSIPDLKHLSLLLVRLDYLIAHKKPLPHEQDPAFQEVMEYANEHYRLHEQYTSQVSFLREIGILHTKEQPSQKTRKLSDFFSSLLPFGKKKRPELSKESEGPFFITGIDGKEYPIPTLEQIAVRLFERRQELAPKHDQGFTKLLLVPFGMSLDTLRETLKRFLLDYKKKHPNFGLDTDDPLYIWRDYQGADTDTNPYGTPLIVYCPTFFHPKNHQGKTKAQILEEQGTNSDSFPGWTIHLLQPSNPKNPNSPGIAHIPREGQGKTHGQDHEDPLDPLTLSRPDLEAGKSPEEYLSPLRASQSNPDSPYFHETGLTPEDWILAFMTHLRETGKPLDDALSPTSQESLCFLTNSFFHLSNVVPGACWSRDDQMVYFDVIDHDGQRGSSGFRSSVKI